MLKLDDYQLNILQKIANQISCTVRQIENGQVIVPDSYYDTDVLPCDNGIWLVPDEARFIGDFGEFMGTTFEQAKFNIGFFVDMWSY